MAPPPLLNWRVLSRNDLTHDVFELRLERPALPDASGKVAFKAGQYMSIVIPGAGPGGRNLRRAYSIASPPETDQVELCVKLVDGGPGTTYLNKLRPGDEFQAQAPFGDFYLEHDQNLPALFIGTGTGLAPLRSMILAKEWTSKAPVGFLLGVREERDIIYPELFCEDRPAPLRGHKHVEIALSRPTGQANNASQVAWRGFKGRVTDYLRQMDWDFAQTHYYLCGNGAMIAEVKEVLGTKGVPKEQIHTEKYY
jgi:CDP-4-dehydro-6-deoxyglucose reductase